MTKIETPLSCPELVPLERLSKTKVIQEQSITKNLTQHWTESSQNSGKKQMENPPLLCFFPP